MDKEKDLGFFNGIKTELIPIIAGLVSFTLLVEQATNNISDFFSISEKAGTMLFVISYFIVPVVGLIIWITLVNYHDGLKKRIRSDWKSRYSWPFLILLSLLIILCVLFFVVEVLVYTLVSVVFVFVASAVAVVLLLRNRANRYKFRRERYQANWQFGIVFLLLVAFWGLYFGLNFIPRNANSVGAKVKPQSEDEYAARKSAMNQGLFDSAFEKAITAREDTDTRNEQSRDFADLFQNYIYRLCPCDSVDDAKQIALLKSSFEKIVRLDSCNCLDNKASEERKPKILTKAGSLPKPEYFSIYNTETLKYQIDTQLKRQDDRYRIYWSAWLRSVQYRGLMLFALTTLFLLAVWYFAYTASLESQKNDGQPGEYFSEINISKISLYIIFLLTIPFFKPVTRENTVFAKPYITFNNPLTLVDNSKIALPPKIEFPDFPEVNYKTLADSVRNELERRGNKLHRIDSMVQKEPQKKSKKR
jgi:hypothetical protein